MAFEELEKIVEEQKLNEVEVMQPKEESENEDFEEVLENE